MEMYGQMSLEDVARYRSDTVSTAGGHAVVVGSGIAGLLAARVLADGFHSVTVLERDFLPATPNPRDGIPQSHHVHAMLEAGRVTIEDLCPGYGKEVRASGGMEIDAASEFDYYHKGGFLADGPRRLPMLCASRSLFEHVLRNRVDGHERVSTLSEVQVTDYVLNGEDGSAVTGVEYVAKAGGKQRLQADLVVDATGRASRTPGWLDRNGFSAPPVEEVEIDLMYSSVAVERPPADRRAYLVAPSPPQARGGTVIPVEGDRWMVTLFGLHGDHPPADVEGFRAFAGSLPTPELAELLDEHALNTDEIHQYPFPSNRWYHYEDISRFPDGLIPIGDAIASFNPIYGQGMSVAALQALRLHHTLAEDGLQAVPTRFLTAVADIVGGVWRTTVGIDFSFPQTTGNKPLGTDIFNRYMNGVIRTAHTDGEVAEALARVLRLERAPPSLFHPRILVRVGRSYLPC